MKGDVHDIGKNIVGVVLQCNNYRVIDLGVMVPAAKILQAARDEKADAIGLSGLITPSLDEMVHVAGEMEREGLMLPLLIGGATTSRAHTAVKIAPHYRSTTVHVLDASRAVGVVSSLLNDDLKAEFDTRNRADHERLREEYLAKIREKKLISLDDARARKPSLDWDSYAPPQPSATGLHIVGTGSPNESDGLPCASVSLETLIEYIDWSPFFHTWELRGRYPAIFDDPVVGEQARELFEDAQKLLATIVREKSFTARGVWSLWPARSDGDDVRLYNDASAKSELATFHFLRQQMQKPADQPNYCLADFISPAQPDHLGGFAVTIHGADEVAAKFAAAYDDYNAILTKALADRLAEAFAEYLHREVRIAWGFGSAEKLSHEDLLRERYQGIRPAAGYPACPDHAEKTTLFDLLQARRLCGMTLTESFAMHPGSSVSGLYFSHPAAKYFGVGPIGRDQVEDYARRRNEPIEAVEKRLSPHLGYER